MLVESGLCRTKNIDGVENVSPDLWVIAVVLSALCFWYWTPVAGFRWRASLTTQGWDGLCRSRVLFLARKISVNTLLFARFLCSRKVTGHCIKEAYARLSQDCHIALVYLVAISSQSSFKWCPLDILRPFSATLQAAILLHLLIQGSIHFSATSKLTS